MSVNSFITSFSGLFDQLGAVALRIERVEIPIIQRDYAQGRGGDSVRRIRANFLDALHGAVTGGTPIGLDFVYGEVKAGTFEPLDGQQRLTTLFLLHWYLAARSGRLADPSNAWKRFSYATRASARLFCKRLVDAAPTFDEKPVSAWLQDQAWYLSTWRHDPTIDSMLVMIDAIHDRFRADDFARAWERLTDRVAPAVSFHLLPMGAHGLGHELYIKMNSRGKPLTPFENFKARFEQTLEKSCPAEHVNEFAKNVDGAWADVLWPYHGGDFIVDDEFLRYFQFVTEVCEWRAGRVGAHDFERLVDSVYGPENPQAAANLEFLGRAFDTWRDEDVAGVFRSLFATSREALDEGGPERVVLFGHQTAAENDLFEGCCRYYGDLRGKQRVFTLPRTLYLHAVLTHRFERSTEVGRRMRVVRNLIEASGNEIRLERMPALIADVTRVIVEGSVDGLSGFNQAQAAEERSKASLLSAAPQLAPRLFELEDHPILRGSLAAFDLDAAVFERRALAFRRLFASEQHWTALTGALLALGDYHREVNRWTFRFGAGANEAPWRDLFTGGSRDELARTRGVLGALLDEVASSNGSDDEGVAAALTGIETRWLASVEAAKRFDWRYYLVKYPAMREGRSGIYVSESRSLGYDLCMLDKTLTNSWYRDPYLFAMLRESGVSGAVTDPWFTGFGTERWMQLEKTGAGMRSVSNGVALRPPADAAYADVFARVCTEQRVGATSVMTVPQAATGQSAVDMVDRVQLGAQLLRALVAAGL